MQKLGAKCPIPLSGPQLESISTGLLKVSRFEQSDFAIQSNLNAFPDEHFIDCPLLHMQPGQGILQRVHRQADNLGYIQRGLTYRETRHYITLRRAFLTVSTVCKLGETGYPLETSSTRSA
jgi:hypothetical protein